MKKLIIIRGSSGVGKTSVIKKILKKLGKKIAYIPVANTTYSLIPQDILFAPDKLITLMHDNADDLIRNFLKANYTVVSDAIFSHKTMGKSRLKKLVQIGKNIGARVYVFELHADLPTLKNRAKKRGREKDIKTNYKFIEKKHHTFLKTRQKDSIPINTQNKSINTIANTILKIIKKK